MINTIKPIKFQYYTSLNLNMSYYHIRLIKEASNLCTIILPWVCDFPDIFQEKTNGIFNGIEFISTNIHDLLTITKGDWYYHSNKL